MSISKGKYLVSNIVMLIKNIPKGKVATYGQIAGLAGNHRATRLVVWTLNSASKKESLPWYRVVNSKGTISLKPGWGYEEQKRLLESEGIIFDKNNKINLLIFQWKA
jgi:methylated-DNA-protein-cysteine methyltransferase-like protein